MLSFNKYNCTNYIGRIIEILGEKYG